MRLWIKTFRELTTEELYEILRRIPGGRHPARPDETVEVLDTLWFLVANFFVAKYFAIYGEWMGNARLANLGTYFIFSLTALRISTMAQVSCWQ